MLQTAELRQIKHHLLPYFSRLDLVISVAKWWISGDLLCARLEGKGHFLNTSVTLRKV